MTKYSKMKHSIYFPDRFQEALRQEAERTERSVSWVVRECVRKCLLPDMKRSSVAKVVGRWKDRNAAQAAETQPSEPVSEAVS